MKWFNNPETLEELKKQYFSLAKKWHPDTKTGDTEAMKEINNEYEYLFERLKNTHKNSEGEVYTERTETTETAADFADIIEKLLHLAGLEIEICGSWIWVTGNTKAHKEDLKALNFRWSNNKCAWYYHRDPYHRRSRKTFTLDEIRDRYGSVKVSQNSGANIATA